MTSSTLLRTLSLVAVLGAALCLSPAHAQGKPAGVGGGKPAGVGGGKPAGVGGGGGGGVAPVTTLKAVLAQLQQNQAAIVQAGKDLVSAAQAILVLDDATLDLLEADLEAAYDSAKDQFEALDPADQTDANLRSLIVTAINQVWPLYTTDAGQLAALGTAAQAFADTVSPLEIARLDLLAQLKAAAKAQGAAKRAAKGKP